MKPPHSEQLGVVVWRLKPRSRNTWRSSGLDPVRDLVIECCSPEQTKRDAACRQLQRRARRNEVRRAQT